MAPSSRSDAARRCVQSRSVMFYYCVTIRGKRYGPGTSRQRRDNARCPSSNTAIRRPAIVCLQTMRGASFDRGVEPLLPYIDYFMPSTEGAGNMSGRRATLRDAAAHTSVSVATFSHVVNETKAVKARTRAAVLAAAAALGYRPNTVARSLVARRGRALSGLPESAPRLIAICYVSIDYMVEIDRVPQPGARTSSRSIGKMLGEPAANVAVFAAGMDAPLAVQAELVTLFATMPTAPGRLNGWPSAGWIAARRCASPARGCRAVSSWSSRTANARSSTNPASAAGTCDASSHRSHGPGVPDVPAFGRVSCGDRQEGGRRLAAPGLHPFAARSRARPPAPDRGPLRTVFRRLRSDVPEQRDGGAHAGSSGRR